MGSSVVTSVIQVGGLDVCLWMHIKDDPTDADWDAGHAHVLSELRRLNSKAENRRGIVMSDLGAPNTKQRAQVKTEVWENLGGHSSVFTPMLNNPIKRGIATALVWMMPQLKFLRPEEWNIGLTHIGLNPERDGETVLAAFEQMQKRIFTNQTLSAVISIARGTALRRSGT